MNDRIACAKAAAGDPALPDAVSGPRPHERSAPPASPPADPARLLHHRRRGAHLGAAGRRVRAAARTRWPGARSWSPARITPVAASPVGPFEALVAIPKGMADAALDHLLRLPRRRRLRRRGANGRAGAAGRAGWRGGSAGRGIWVIPIVGFAFAWGGILIQMQEELIAFVPVLLLLVRRLGFNALTAVAMSLGAAAVGASFSSDQPVPGRHRAEGGRARARSAAGSSARWCSPLAWLVWIARDDAFRAAHAQSRPSPSAAETVPTGGRPPPAGARRWCWASCSSRSSCSSIGVKQVRLGLRPAVGAVLPHGGRGRTGRRARAGRHGRRLRRGIPLDGVRGAAHRVRARDLRRARPGARRGHDRPRAAQPRSRPCRPPCRRSA